MMSNKYNLINIKATALTAGLLFILSNSVSAAGFASNDQSVTYLGNAYAGTCSATQDASTSYYNPAGMNELKHSGAVFSTTYVNQNIQLYNATATNSVPEAISGNNPAKPKANLSLSAGHITWRVNKDFSLGLSVVEPFALDTRYSNTDIARLMATENKITTTDISPSVAVRLNPYLSVGAALDFLRIKSKISSGVSWASVGSEANGFIINTGNSSHAIGWHLGVLIKPQCNTQIGLVYFSSFNPKIYGTTLFSGTLDFGNPNQVNYSIKMPAHVNVGITHHFNSKWTAMSEVQWTHWNKLTTVVMNYNSSALPGIKSFYYKNTFRVSLGSDYKVTRKLTLKGGLAHDQSPTRDKYRSAMLPDSDRYLLGLGARFAFTKQFSVVAGYSHAFYRKATIAERGSFSGLNQSPFDANNATLNANVKNSADIFGLQVVLSLG